MQITISIVTVNTVIENVISDISIICINVNASNVVEMPYFILGLFPTVTRGNGNVTITSKRRRLDAIMALSLSHLSAVFFFNTTAIELMLDNAWNDILGIQNRSTNMV